MKKYSPHLQLPFSLDSGAPRTPTYMERDRHTAQTRLAASRLVESSMSGRHL